ncbi:histidine kinase N-terminal 7TM domain-containing protein [Chloroflexus sp.]|uniref:histidine kinase N-terminal 7TM domain-containing protein n=1 Tax=Chloroflexus sp. TaxID=1904827 RepID=UPI002ACDD84A|nr:histidine kinase N-terminal 7TM domain-containing protein [Chloroflexus sp.]
MYRSSIPRASVHPPHPSKLRYDRGHVSDKSRCLSAPNNDVSPTIGVKEPARAGAFRPNPPVFWYGSALFVIGLMCLILALQIFLFLRQSPGAIALGLLLVALSWWDITYALYWIDAPAPNDQFWVDVTYLLGVVSAPTLVLIFAMQISDLFETSRLLRWPFFLVMAIESTVTLLAFMD